MSVPVDQAEVVPADGDAVRSHSDRQSLALCVPRPVPLHAVVLQRRYQLQGLILHRALAHPLQSLVLGYDAAKETHRPL